MNTFSQNLAEKTTTELQGVLSNFNQLTVASKKELYSFLRDREGFDREKLDALQKDIESHDSEVENLKYLRNVIVLKQQEVQTSINRYGECPTIRKKPTNSTQTSIVKI